MTVEGFKNWLLASGQKKSAAENRVANCATVEREQRVDLDVCYANDRCEHLIDLLTYSREDKGRNIPPRHNIPIDGDVYNGTATYKSAVKKYVAYKEDGRTAQRKPTSPKKFPPKVEQKSIMLDSAKARKDVSDDFKTILLRFRKWLVEEADLKQKSACQYKTYINKLRSAVDGHFGLGWFESLPSEYLKDMSEELLIQCSSFIEDSIRNVPKPDRKMWNNWRSAFHAFVLFLHDIADVYNKDSEAFCKEIAKATTTRKRKAKPTCQPFDLKCAMDEEIIATYTHQELARAFMGRLKTQSRYYPKFDLLFPPRLLTKMFKRSKRNIWIEWLKHDLEDMRILVSNDSPVPFSDVRRFEFHGDGTVLITKNDGRTFEMMTRTADGGIAKEFARRGLRDVSIDHVEPIEKVLRRNMDRLGGLRQLTELFHAFEKLVARKLDPRAEKDWVGAFYDQHRQRLGTDEMRDLIVSDLKILDLEFELMDTRYNSIKGKGA